MQEDLRNIITQRIDQLQPGAIFSLGGLLADVWDTLGVGKERRSIGNNFSRAVRKGEFPNCIAIGLIGTDRDAKYRRVG